MAGLIVLFQVAAGWAATILVYHSFGVASSMSISMQSFSAQLDYLEQAGYKVIPMDELVQSVVAHRNPPDRSVVIAIDDGWASVMKAHEELVRRNLPYTLFLPMAYVANPGCRATLSQADIDRLKTWPKVTFADHSWSHSPRLAGNEDFAREDIRKSRERFRQVIGYDPVYFAYPYGAVSETYTRLLRESGFSYLFVTGDRPVNAETKPVAIPRIAAHNMPVQLLASVLRSQETVLAKSGQAPAQTPPAHDARLLSATGSAARSGNVE